MATVTLTQTVEAIATFLGAAVTLTGGLGTSQPANEMKEGVPDLPTLQVYPESGIGDSTGNTDRTTFGGASTAPVRVRPILFHADYYARQRSHLAEDLAAVMIGADAIMTVLDSHRQAPYFGLAGIKAFHWDFQRVTFIYGENDVKYAGIRFLIQIWYF